MPVMPVLIGVVIGVVVGFLASYPVGFLRELGREHASRLLVRRRDERQQQVVEAEAQAVTAATEAETARQRAHLARLTEERVGAKFLHRVQRDDPGLVATVLRLDDRYPLLSVLVSYEPTPGRESTPYDPENRQTVEWGSLTESEAAQRHRAAVLVENSHDDADGWLQYEPLTP